MLLRHKHKRTFKRGMYTIHIHNVYIRDARSAWKRGQLALGFRFSSDFQCTIAILTRVARSSFADDARTGIVSRVAASVCRSSPRLHAREHATHFDEATIEDLIALKLIALKLIARQVEWLTADAGACFSPHFFFAFLRNARQQLFVPIFLPDCHADTIDTTARKKDTVRKKLAKQNRSCERRYPSTSTACAPRTNWT